MLRMCVCMHSCFDENHPIRILEDGPLIYEVVLSQRWPSARLTEVGNEFMAADNPCHSGRRGEGKNLFM
jgi:hypothetical protein